MFEDDNNEEREIVASIIMRNEFDNLMNIFRDNRNKSKETIMFDKISDSTVETH
jgi:hypothetical protein